MKHTPCLVCVTGLKNSGKTTVCTAVIADLCARGYSVAALKSSHVAELTLDHRAGDSYALAASGARFVLVQGTEHSLVFEQVARSFQQILGRVPEGMDFIISEGGEARAAAAVIVCLTKASAWEETLRVRCIPEDRILAVSGFFVGDSGPASFQEFPVVDIKNTRDRQSLVERILISAAPRKS